MPHNSSGTKLRRKVISLETKIQILDRLASGQRVSFVGKQLGLNEATVRTIKKNEEAVRRAEAVGTDLSCKSYTRDIAKLKMEKALLIWIEDNAKKKIPIDGNAIKQTALKMYRNIKDTEPETSLQLNKKSEFSASTGWMRRFFNRYGFNNIKGLTPSNGEEEFDNNELLDEDMHELLVKKFLNDEEETDPLCQTPDFQVKMDTNEDRVLSTDFIKDGLEIARKLGDHFVKYDPNNERSMNFQRELKSIMSVYSQPLITEYFVKKPALRNGTADNSDSTTKPKRIGTRLFKESYF